MSEKRFTPKCNFQKCQFISHIKDNENQVVLDINGIVDLLNEQEATIRKLQDLCGESDGENVKLRQEIKELKAQLREKDEDERLYANEIVKLNKEAKEVLDFKTLGGDY